MLLQCAMDFERPVCVFYEGDARLKTLTKENNVPPRFCLCLNGFSGEKKLGEIEGAALGEASCEAWVTRGGAGLDIHCSGSVRKEALFCITADPTSSSWAGCGLGVSWVWMSSCVGSHRLEEVDVEW